MDREERMEHVRAFLGRRDVDLSQYAQTFEENGFDNLSYLMELSPKKQRSIAKKIPMPEGHIQRFLDGLKKTKMSVIYALIPIAIIFVIIAVAVFFWAVRSDQFEDIERQGLNILMDDEDNTNNADDESDKPKR